MLINVWGLIWPNQKKILGIVSASDEEKNKARRVAFLASRTQYDVFPFRCCISWRRARIARFTSGRTGSTKKRLAFASLFFRARALEQY